MVASLLLVVVMAGFVPFFLSGLERSSEGRFKSAATNIARERIEQIRQFDYREIQEDTANPTDPENLSVRFAAQDAAEEVKGTNPFVVSYAVDNSGYGPTGELKKVTVTVDWTGTGATSPAIISTLVHQQFLGPRGGKLEVSPVSADPRGTPFPQVGDPFTIRYHVAEADWDLVLDNLNQPGEAKRLTYALMRLVDNAGAVIPLGDSTNDYHMDAGTHLMVEHDAVTGEVTDIYFEYEGPAGVGIDRDSIPDGYWELQAVAYNEFNQPGNVWRLRIRVNNGIPAPAQSLTAVGQADNETIELTWIPTPDRDIATWEVERKASNTPGVDWGTVSWATVTTLKGTASAYTDKGSIASTTHPFGDPTNAITNYYRYRIRPIDIDGNLGDWLSTDEQLPTATTTTTVVTTSTTSTSSTSTTSGTFTVSIVNNAHKEYSISIRDASNSQVATGTVAKNGGSADFSGLPPGSYQIQATEMVATGANVVNASFNLPDDAGQVVMTIF